MSLDASQRRLTVGSTSDPSAIATSTKCSDRRRNSAATAAAAAKRQAEWADRLEDVRWMAAHGETRAGCARRLGIGWNTLVQQFVRNGVPMPAFPGDYDWVAWDMGAVISR